MSHTSLQTEIYGPSPASFRPLITLQEYDKQGKDCTKQELKQAALYYQHVFHFVVLSVTQKLAFLWTRKALCISLIATLLLACAIGMSGEAKSTSEGGGLVPATSFTQKVINLPYEFLDKIRQFTGQAKKGLLLPEDPVFGSVAENNSSQAPQTPQRQPVGNKHNPNRDSLGKEAPEQDVNTEGTVEETALVDSTSFSTFIQSQTAKGMDIFSFAYCVARDFATNVFAKAFGWTQNGTILAS